MGLGVLKCILGFGHQSCLSPLDGHSEKFFFLCELAVSRLAQRSMIYFMLLGVQKDEEGPVVYETWGEGNVSPPSAASEYIVKDRGNATPRAMRPTLHLVPAGADLLKQSGLPLAVVLQPLAAPQPGDTPLQVRRSPHSHPCLQELNIAPGMLDLVPAKSDLAKECELSRAAPETAAFKDLHGNSHINS